MRKKTIVCFGDSNTYGYDSETGGRLPEYERYTGRLSLLLPKYSFKEEGLNGRTMCLDDPTGEGRNALPYLTPCLLSHKPLSLLIIMLGTNDVKGFFGMTPHLLGRCLDRLIKKAIATSAWEQSPNILVIAPPPVDPIYRETWTFHEFGSDADQRSLEAEPIFRSVALENGCHYLNAGNIPGMKLSSSDGIHLTRKSHELLAKVLASKIPDLLS